METSRITIGPIANAGNDSPNSETTPTVLSRHLPRCSAARMPGGNRSQQRNHQRGKGQLQRVGISLQDEVRDRIVQPQRMPKVSVQHSAPVVQVLLAQRQIESVLMAQRGQIGRRCAFAQHLLHRIARHQVNQQKDQRDHQPDNGKRIQQTRGPARAAASCASSCRQRGRMRRGCFGRNRLDAHAADAVSTHLDNSVAASLKIHALARRGNVPKLRQQEPGQRLHPAIARQVTSASASPGRADSLRHPCRTPPPASVQRGRIPTSNSSSISPISCSIASSTVTSPTVEPCSSTTIARCRRRS